MPHDTEKLFHTPGIRPIKIVSITSRVSLSSLIKVDHNPEKLSTLPGTILDSATGIATGEGGGNDLQMCQMEVGEGGDTYFLSNMVKS